MVMVFVFSRMSQRVTSVTCLKRFVINRKLLSDKAKRFVEWLIAVCLMVGDFILGFFF
ncbi:Unannotated [Lentimonas sp. CC4]|nr:Unannotated [Lentimonas sp. CC4]CAA6685555.1 Unannotated [Lentimonas sp. CC6]CAA7077002.1 Unannotated [Lentimonas sp. CC4]CAA7170553.1 Unannotated [Lentimonas sp. CC21]CAA7180718.1 Unannotated [Lentimonas sp. CC8]